ncbi:MAG TPA: adenylate/guanylate cyclase domain-containing protein [Myxococcales bacterium]|jgi:class 3 adenylate cyclase
MTSLPSRPSEQRRASDVLEALLEQSSRQSEIVIAYLRLGIGTVALVKFLSSLLMASSPSLHSALDSAVMASGIVFSGVILTLAARKVPTARLSIAAVIFDAGLALHFPLLDALLPEPGYLGLLSNQNFALPCLVAACAGVRLSRRVALWGVIGAFVSLVAALTVEVLAAPWTQPGLGRICLGLGYYGCFATLGLALAHRARKLVYSAADKAVEAERVRQRLGAYVSEEVALQALQGPELTLGGRRQDVAALFSDLRGFTSWSERLEPERIVSQLNDYLDAVVTAIRAEGGVVDKYIGDSVMVVFGIPEPRPDDAARALRAAAGMQRALEAHNAVRVKRGLPPLAQGVGVHFGPAVAGNIGTSDHLAVHGGGRHGEPRQPAGDRDEGAGRRGAVLRGGRGGGEGQRRPNPRGGGQGAHPRQGAGGGDRGVRDGQRGRRGRSPGGGGCQRAGLGPGAPRFVPGYAALKQPATEVAPERCEARLRGLGGRESARDENQGIRSPMCTLHLGIAPLRLSLLGPRRRTSQSRRGFSRRQAQSLNTLIELAAAKPGPRRTARAPVRRSVERAERQ